MSLSDQARRMKPDAAIPRLILVGICVIGLTLGAGFLLERNISRLIDARNWYEHSLEVQANLQAIQLRMDRLDAVGHLYLETKLWTSLREAQNLSLTIESNGHQIADLVSDNAGQNANVHQLNACTRQLVEAMRSLDAPGAKFPSALQLGCRETVLLMVSREHSLSQERSKQAQSTTTSLTVIGLSLAAFSMLMVAGLFGVLIRDALFRHKVQEQTAAANEQLAQTISVLESRAAEMHLLGAVRDQLQICVAAQDACNTSVHFVSQLLPGSSGALCMIDNSRQMIELKSAWGSGAPTLEAFPVDACCAMRSGQIRWRSPGASVLHCEHFLGPAPERYLCLPLVAHGDTLGMLYVECRDAEAVALVEHHIVPLRALLQLTSMTVAGLNLRKRLENQSIRDSLTGLFNRHFMELSLEREIRRTSRRNTGLAVFMIDTDHFKQFNDTFGHPAGDKVLAAIAERFHSSVRGEDVVCRYGGEEFVVILPDINPDKAVERAEYIRETISGLRVLDNGQTLGRVTVSIGIAMYPQDGRSIEELLHASDRRLYTAKNRGRNQVVLDTEVTGSPRASI